MPAPSLKKVDRKKKQKEGSNGKRKKRSDRNSGEPGDCAHYSVEDEDDDEVLKKARKKKTSQKKFPKVEDMHSKKSKKSTGPSLIKENQVYEASLSISTGGSF